MPKLLGILNLSADSFSDGGLYSELDAAIAHARRLIEGGAAVIDIGAVSSNPDGAGLDSRAEIDRLAPVVDALMGAEIPVSIDSFAPDTQIWAAGQQVAMLNDIRGFPEPRVWPVLADSDAQLVLMHSLQGGRADRRPGNASSVLDAALQFFEHRLEQLLRAGIDEDRLIIDPGMGFFLGSQPEPSVELLRQIDTLRARTGRPVLISVSRKSFLGNLLGGRAPSDRHDATVAAEVFAVDQGAEWIRTHDPRALTDALRIRSALRG